MEKKFSNLTPGIASEFKKQIYANCEEDSHTFEG